MKTLKPSARPSYWSFGYLPTGSRVGDLQGRLWGNPNLLKRLQAPDVVEAMAIETGHDVLDLGCGSGYFTVEFAKLGQSAVGVDVNPYVEGIEVPESLRDRLSFRKADGTALPFEADLFDRILASEVLPMIPDPRLFLGEIRRVLRPEGRAVFLNGSGPLPIRDAYERRLPWLRRLADRYPERFPQSYDEYCAQFQKVAGTAQSRFFSDEEVLTIIRDAGFRIVSDDHTPGRRAGEYLARRQLEHYLKTGEIVATPSFLPNFLFLSALSKLDGDGYPGGLLVVAVPD